MKRAVFLVLLGLAACTGTSPEPDYYALNAIDGAQHPGINLMIKVERPSLPDYLDRPDIVRQESAYQYKIDEFDRWAEPLDRMFERVLAEDLRQRLPNSTVLSEADTGTMNMTTVVETGIQQFNETDQNSLALNAVLTVTDNKGVPLGRPQTLSYTAPGGTSLSDLAAGLSRLIAAYADGAASALPQQKTQN